MHRNHLLLRVARRLAAYRQRFLNFSYTIRARWYEKRYYPQVGKIATHLTPEEKYVLYGLSRDISSQHANAVFLEIGSYVGASAVTIASAFSNNTSLYCVDTWQNETMPDGLRDTFEEFTENTRHLSSYITPLRGRSEAVAVSFDKTLDFIFFDGDHSYEGIKTDVDCWLPRLVSGGIAVFHDSGWAEGVQRVIQEEILPRALEHGSLPNMVWAKLP